MKLPRYRKCFVCGIDNPCGLGAQPELVDNSVVLRFKAEERHCGFKQWLHGGVTASLLDEAMFWVAAVALKKMVATAELSVHYRKPISIGQELEVRAYLLQGRGRIAETYAEVLDAGGKKYALGTGKYVAIQGKGQGLSDFFPDDPTIAQADLGAFEIRPVDRPTD